MTISTPHQEEPIKADMIAPTKTTAAPTISPSLVPLAVFAITVASLMTLFHSHKEVKSVVTPPVVVVPKTVTIVPETTKTVTPAVFSGTRPSVSPTVTIKTDDTPNIPVISDKNHYRVFMFMKNGVATRIVCKGNNCVESTLRSF